MAKSGLEKLQLRPFPKLTESENSLLKQAKSRQKLADELRKSMSEHETEQAELLEELNQNGSETLAREFSVHRERLWRMVHFRLDRRLSGRIDADDILQEAYLEALKRLHHFINDPAMSLFVWLRLIVGQTMVDVHRRHLGTEMRNAEREIPLHSRGVPQASSISLAAMLLGTMTSPSGAAMKKELTGQLEKIIEQMSPIDREILALRHFEELTNSEVAEVLEIEQKAASIRYVRAIKRLKTLLSTLPEFSGDSTDGNSEL